MPFLHWEEREKNVLCSVQIVPVLKKKTEQRLFHKNSSAKRSIWGGGFQLNDSQKKKKNKVADELGLRVQRAKIIGLWISVTHVVFTRNCKHLNTKNENANVWTQLYGLKNKNCKTDPPENNLWRMDFKIIFRLRCLQNFLLQADKMQIEKKKKTQMRIWKKKQCRHRTGIIWLNACFRPKLFLEVKRKKMKLAMENSSPGWLISVCCILFSGLVALSKLGLCTNNPNNLELKLSSPIYIWHHSNEWAVLVQADSSTFFKKF